jgi:hypothetical protein
MTNFIEVYCTKYALTQGIFKLEGEMVEDGKYFAERKLSTRGAGIYGLFLSPKDFCLTEEEALADFHKRKLAKISALQRQIQKLQSLTPNIEDNPNQ